MFFWFTLLSITVLTNQKASNLSVEQVGKMHFGPNGDVYRIVVVDNTKALMVNGLQVDVVAYKNLVQPTLISSVKNDWTFWRGSLAYCSATRALAHADSTDNTAIYFYSMKPDGQFAKTKTIAFGAEYKRGPTLILAYSPSGSVFAYANKKQKPITLLETKGYGEVASLPLEVYVDMLHFLNDKLLMAVSIEGQATIWEVSSHPPRIMKEFHVPLEPTLTGVIKDIHLDDVENVITLVYFTPAGQLGVSEISYRDTISVKNRTVALGEWSWFHTCKLSPNKKYLLTGDTKANLRVLDISTPKATMVLQRKLEDAREIRSIEYLDESHVAVGCLGEWLYVFKIREV